MVPGLEGTAGDRAGTTAGGKEKELLTEGVKEEKVTRRSHKLLDISGSLVNPAPSTGLAPDDEYGCAGEVWLSE
jgi:hypothetical protein